MAIMDRATRRVLSWRLSNGSACGRHGPRPMPDGRRVLHQGPEDAIRLHGRPGFFGTDQDSRFTGPRFTDVLQDAEVTIPTDGSRSPDG